MQSYYPMYVSLGDNQVVESTLAYRHSPIDNNMRRPSISIPIRNPKPQTLRMSEHIKSWLLCRPSP